ncbi:MAG: T9SS type A sorting domain-containing protein [Bacteroidota bacterium]
MISRISFLFSLFCIAIHLLPAQSYSEGFDGGDRGAMISNCWFFSSTSIRTSGSDLITGNTVRTGQLTNTTNPHTMGIPCTEFAGTGTIEFDHKVHTMAGNIYKQLDVVLVDPSSGTSRAVMDTIFTHTYTNTNLVNTVLNVDFSGEYKIEFRWIGRGGQGRGWLDNLTIGGTNISDPDNGCACKSSNFPVEWADFQVSWQSGTSLLEWTTAWESNTSHFVVERSLDGANFTGVGTQAAMGNSSEPVAYRFEDATVEPVAAASLLYRIKQVDLNGSFSYSDLQSLVIEKNVHQLQLYPNPTQEQVTIQTRSDREGSSRLLIFDLMGRTVFQQNMSTASFETDLSLSAWPKGNYWVSWQQGGNVQIQHLVVQ